MTTPQLFADGVALHLGKRIGKGGEGEVYALADGPTRAVKLYTARDGADREAKIRAMVNMRLAERSSLAAFPMAIARDRSGGFVGFVMRLVRDHQPLFELYSPAARKQNFPQASYQFLVRAALNTAKAIAAVHEVGCVIGDINHSGILISKQATAALIDADSFQVIDGTSRYLCRVGVPEYTPPELQGQSLGGVVRTPNHDAFGLAIVVFQLLAMGRHPFVGSYAKGEMPIEKAISEFCFAYSLRRSVGMKPPPGACTLKDLSPLLAEAFESAFSKEQAQTRPTAKQWVTLLETFEKTLIKCSANSIHHYSSAATECPWCRMEQRLAVVLFVPTYADFTAPKITIDVNQPSLSQLWAQVEAIQLPSRAQIVPTLPPRPSLTPSPEAQLAARNRFIPVALRVAGIIAALLIVVIVPAAWWIAAAAAWGGHAVAKNFRGDLASHYNQKVTAIDNELRRAFEQWVQRVGIDRAEALKSSLRETRRIYENLKSEEEQRVAQYQKDRKAVQKRQYLDRFRIRDYKIRGIGPAKLATLASYGIETAGDVNQSAVCAVPGFGPTNSQPLFDWQAECAQRFVYNAQPTAMDQVELGKIRAETLRNAQELRDRVTKEARGFMEAALACRRILATPDPLLASLHHQRSQIEIDCGFLGLSLPPRPTYQPNHSTSPKMGQSAVPITATTARTTSATAAHAHSPNCPRCHTPMVRRTARRGRRAGRAFWGCSRYPSCRGTRPI
jgi:DNA-binding helix-hairpin-helix protein with protein kinase domain